MLSQRKIGGLYRGTPISRSIKVSHVIFAIVDAIDLYSASTLDHATVVCFLALHDIQLLPRTVKKPVMDR